MEEAAVLGFPSAWAGQAFGVNRRGGGGEACVGAQLLCIALLSVRWGPGGFPP